jgi:hypothetical protein
MSRLNINLPTPLYTRLRDEAHTQQRTITVLVCRALEEFLAKQDCPESVMRGNPNTRKSSNTK